MWYELINQLLDLTKSPLVAQFILMLFPSVGQNKSDRLVTYLFRWQYTVKILI